MTSFHPIINVLLTGKKVSRDEYKQKVMYKVGEVMEIEWKKEREEVVEISPSISEEA